MTATMLAPGQPPAPGPGQPVPAGPVRTRPGVPWRTAGIGLTWLGPPVGAGVSDPRLGLAMIVIELAVVLTIIGTALYGSQSLSERAFRLLRWLADRPEPTGPVSSPARP